jgi:hypothetical protein
MRIDIAKLKELIDNSIEDKIQKSKLNYLVKDLDENLEKEFQDKSLITKVAEKNRSFEVVLSTDEVKIYKIRGKEDWDKKYPYRLIFFNSVERWESCSTVSPTFDIALLVFLTEKYLGSNSQFSSFAQKMLGIPQDY